jgi:RNA polymerase sigma-70 factor (ECF subfamily)
LAEDALQTAYLKILQGRARYNGRAAFKTWLFAVIRTTDADERRRQWLRYFRLSGQEQQPGIQLPVCGDRLDRSEGWARSNGTGSPSFQELPVRSSSAAC